IPSGARGARSAQALPAAGADARRRGPEREPARRRSGPVAVVHHPPSPGARARRPGEGGARWQTRRIPGRAARRPGSRGAGIAVGGGPRGGPHAGSPPRAGAPRAPRRASKSWTPGAGPPAPRARGRGRRPRAPRRAAIPAGILGAAIHIDSAAELEPPVVDSAPDRESGITSDPADTPAWRRGDLEDFLL